MGKGISLEQFKSQLETDATKRCEAQEKTIKELHQQISEKDKWIEALENRCFALSGGGLCRFCERKNECHIKNSR